MDDVLIIGGEEIKKGENKNIDIELPSLYNTPSTLRVNVIRGRRSGPTVFVSAAIHGDEINGIEIIRRLKKLNILKRLRGTLILVPVVNVYGLVTLSRYLPDRRDLNRSFPGNESGSLAGRIARIFFKEIVLNSDLGIDLHTGAIHRSNLPQVRTDIKNEFTYDLAKAFEAPVVLHSALRDGSLRSQAMEKGKPILLYEAGEALRFDETSIRIGVKGIVNVLRKMEMLAQSSKKSKIRIPVIAKKSTWTRATQSGLLRSVKSLGDTVEKGEIIAYINEPLEDEGDTVIAPFDGIIIGRSELPLVQEGDATFHIAQFNDLEKAENKIEYFSEEVIERSEFQELNEEQMIE
ncbi:succinylglutamate desuccinylase/aspartoacylase family protein [Arcobacter arenosus]|uniref:Succinylglutamate desuccinylase n=1 Tax=Arcobacter arenosus TaxID=2576037 RepID=A0A5R8Y113_9BACT|nr:succinylglutamate desuccinylase/aspartoacylase family protein [Arcobacter arenosus]TLP37712.1 succinylglutamate desuccinylase [Arcobacter arenosus]